MNELRIDPLTGLQVLMAADRERRPQDFQPELAATAQASAGTCPFCVGNETETPTPLGEICDLHGNWLVRVVPNKYPALTGELGAQEVFVESPEHLVDATLIDAEQWSLILRLQLERFRARLSEENIESVALFKNSGPTAGATLAHVHSQLMAFSFVPLGFAREAAGARGLRKQHGNCYFCETIAAEAASQDRFVGATENFIIICPYAARRPYEVWLLPRTHSARFEQLPAVQIDELAGALLGMQKAVRKVLPTADYNLMLHTSPTTAPTDDPDEQAYHWHWRLLPRTARFAGVELGSGVLVNTVLPEVAAEQLRDAFE
ncbi:galactose-1-phosphate uridylyltransferase [Adhaeretor mobilis]|uniref:Galactose-1-phosphate uridylyltransferase n=1 Tax=Adhaeretor mobilis TaxID=1930276 RepID=A0A517N1V4_9BACT|nr:DUF4931 domain-containing protein [Adhaeretor mobilis]QDT01124.1 Galactose-1-phosphate uridylyltransferase [Adhaeretor mobilis]